MVLYSIIIYFAKVHILKFILLNRENIKYFFLQGNNEPNNSGGYSGFIREKCINRLNWQGNCLNDEHFEYQFPAICEKKSHYIKQFTTMPTTTSVVTTTIMPITTSVVTTTTLPLTTSDVVNIVPT